MTDCDKCDEPIKDNEDIIWVAHGVWHEDHAEHLWSDSEEDIVHECCWDGTVGTPPDIMDWTLATMCDHLKRYFKVA